MISSAWRNTLIHVHFSLQQTYNCTRYSRLRTRYSRLRESHFSGTHCRRAALLLFFYQIFFRTTVHGGTDSPKIHQNCACVRSQRPHRIWTFTVRLTATTTTKQTVLRRGVGACDAEIRIRFTPSDANNCCIFNARLLGNGRYMVTGSQCVMGRRQVATIILTSRHTKKPITLTALLLRNWRRHGNHPTQRSAA